MSFARTLSSVLLLALLTTSCVQSISYQDILQSIVTSWGELYNEFELNSTITACTSDRVLLSCGGGSFTVTTNYSRPISLDDTSLLWATRLEEMLPLSSMDFNDFNMSLPLWQSVCASSQLLDVWTTQNLTNETIVFSYGNYPYGYMRTYPGYQATGEECAELDKSDAKFQSWFVSAVSGPKTLVIIVDVGFREFPSSISDIKTGLLTLINSLNQYDYLGISSSRGSLTMDAVSMATQATLMTIQDSIDREDFSNETSDVHTAVRNAIAMVTSVPVMANVAMVILTDNSFVDPLSINFSSLLSADMAFLMERNIRVFSFLFSEFQEGTILKELSCSTGGLYDRLYNITTFDLSLRVLSYYSFFSASKQPVWSEAKVDIVSGVNSTKVCQAVYREQVGVANLRGVLCLDVPVGDLSLERYQLLVYETPPTVVRPNLTFELENSLRGIHRCDSLVATSAESFRFRVEQLVRLYRVALETAYDGLTTSIRSCPYGDMFYDTCNQEQQAPPPLIFSQEFDCSVNLETSSVYSRGFLAGVIPLLNYSINAFRDSADEAFSLLCASQSLDVLWNELISLREPGLLWSYYGDTLSGLMRYHPYSDCGLTSEQTCSTRKFDPRLRPWYVSSVSGPKRVMLLVHITTDNMIVLDTALAAIDTLTHRDTILTQFVESDGGRLFSDFMPANSTVRQQLMDSISNHQSRSDGDLLASFNTSLGAFQYSSSQTNCHDIILFVTDSSLPISLPPAVRQTQIRLKTSVDVFIFSVGGITVDNTVAMEIACDNRGEIFDIRPGEVESRVHLYLNFYAALVQNNGVVWSEFYTDVFTNKTVLSACLPTYDPRSVETTPTLLGVTCVEVDPLRFNDFSDGELVLDSLINSQAIFCPRGVLTDVQRENIRTKQCGVTVVETQEELTGLFEAIVTEAAILHSQASAQTLDMSECPFESVVLQSCDIDEAIQFTSYDGFSTNVSFTGLGVVTLQDNVSLNFEPFAADQPYYSSLCPAIVQSRVWKRTRSSYNVTTLQFFASDDGALVTYPALQLDCEKMNFDPRFRQYYSTASAYKDVVIVIDLETNHPNFGSSIYSQSFLHILTTLSVVDHFAVIAGDAVFNDNLTAADNESLEGAIEFVSTLVYQATPQAGQVKRSFQLLMTSRLNNMSSNCQVAMVIITNREISAETVDVVTNDNSIYEEKFGKPAKVFINSFINTPDGSEELQLSCDHHGLWNLITPDHFDQTSLIRQKITSYTRVLAKALTLSTPLWSPVYEDELSGELVSSVCLPVYDTVNNIGLLLGVSCVDTSLSLLQSINGSQGVEYLRQLIVSQRRHKNCFIVTLTNQEIDVVRPNGAKCSSLTTPPVTMATMDTMTTIDVTTENQPTVSMATSTTDKVTTTEFAVSSPLASGSVVAIVISLCAVFVCVCVAVVLVLLYANKRHTAGRLSIASEDQLQDKLLEDTGDEL